MIQITNKKDCCGCTACAGVCPRKCIAMKYDGEGFLYPEVDTEQCVDCGLCERICPSLAEKPADNGWKRTAYIGRDKRKDVLAHGTSGGLFTSIGEYILNRGGVVWGVIVDADCVVRHVRVDSLSDKNFAGIPGSKYVRSDIVGVFEQIKTDLEGNKPVVFSGTPCQVAGLKAFLGKEYSGLFTVDVVCRGTPSPLVWKKYVEYQEQKHKSKICYVKFRNKTYGYHSGTMKLVFENGKTYYGSARVDLFLHSFFADLCSRPSCYDCNFKHTEHTSDLTLFDAWHAAQLNTAIRDDDKGYTNIIVQSQKGEELLHALGDQFALYESDMDKAVELDGVMVNRSVQWNAKRETFFDGISDAPLDKHCRKYFRISLKDRLIEKAKKYYYRKRN